MVSSSSESERRHAPSNLFFDFPNMRFKEPSLAVVSTDPDLVKAGPGISTFSPSSALDGFEGLWEVSPSSPDVQVSGTFSCKI